MNTSHKIESPIHAREEFYNLESASSTRHEFHARRIISIGGESPIHSRIIAAAIRVFYDALQAKRICAVMRAQMVRIEADDMDAHPDVVVYAENAGFDSQFPDTLTEPLVMLEVLSPSTKNTDLTTKRTAYFSC